MVGLVVIVAALYLLSRSGPMRLVQLSFAPGHWLDAPAAAAIERAVKASDVPRVNSSTRSREQQQKLYDAYLAGTGNLAARPGTSLHEKGRAIDARGTPSWEAAMVREGWRRTVSSEPWHWEYRQ